jgi:hypothetical protein
MGLALTWDGGFDILVSCDVWLGTNLKSAGHAAVQVLYKCSPECSKTPQNALLQSLLHNNIRKTGSIRNRQVIGSSDSFMIRRK